MSKELTPLEALERIKNAPTIYVGCGSDIYTRYSFECNEIEKALKDYEKKTKLAKEYLDVNNVAKRLMALEIIKEFAIIENNTIIIRIPNHEITENGTRFIEENMKKFDFLKEVLGNE